MPPLPQDFRLSEPTAKDILLGIAGSPAAKIEHLGIIRRVDLRIPAEDLAFYDALSQMTGHSRNMLMVLALESAAELIVDDMDAVQDKKSELINRVHSLLAGIKVSNDLDCLLEGFEVSPKNDDAGV